MCIRDRNIPDKMIAAKAYLMETCKNFCAEDFSCQNESTLKKGAFLYTKKLGKNLPDTGIRDMIDSTKGKEKEFEKILLNLLQAEKVPSNLSLFGAPPV